MSKKQQNLKQVQELMLVCQAIGLAGVNAQEMYVAIVQAQSAAIPHPKFSNEMTKEAQQQLFAAVRASQAQRNESAISLSE